MTAHDDGERQCTTATPHTADAAWRAQYKAQCSGEAMEVTQRWAERRVRWLVDRGVDVDSDLAESLVQDALCAIWAGDEPWDPTRFTLARYVYQIIRARTSKLLTRGRPAAIPLGDLDDQMVSEALERDWTHRVMPPDDQLDAGRAQAEARSLVAAVQTAAAGDRDIERVIAALRDGATTPADIMRATGLTRQAYVTARRRLDRLASRIAPELRAAAGCPAAGSGRDQAAPHTAAACHRRGGAIRAATADRHSRGAGGGRLGWRKSSLAAIVPATRTTAT